MKYGRSSERLEHPQLDLVGGQVVRTEPPEPAGTGKIASLDEQRRKRSFRKQWDGRPHPKPASKCHSGRVSNHLIGRSVRHGDYDDRP